MMKELQHLDTQPKLMMLSNEAMFSSFFYLFSILLCNVGGRF